MEKFTEKEQKPHWISEANTCTNIGKIARKRKLRISQNAHESKFYFKKILI